MFDHQGGFRFRIELGGGAARAFRSTEGLSATAERIEHQGGKDMYAHKIPGRPKVAPVVLKKGYINTAACWAWTGTAASPGIWTAGAASATQRRHGR